MRIAKRIAVALVLASFCAWYAMRFRAEWQQVSFPPLAHSLRIIALVMALSLANYLLRALRWSFYLQQRGHPQRFGFDLLAYIAGFAFTISPGKLGELARARYYTPRGTPLSELAAVSIVERLLDVAAMLILATLAFAAFPAYRLTVVIVASLALIAGILLLRMPRIAAVAQMLDAARSLLRPKHLFLGLLIGLIAWSAEGVGLYLLSAMFGHANLGLAAALGIYALATVSGAATLMPGGLIGTEAVMAALLIASGLSAPDALLVTLASRFATLWFAVGLGWLTVLLLELRTARRPVSIP
jgi:uncharacterized membrane protein YbhN (UPF0104 family)